MGILSIDLICQVQRVIETLPDAPSFRARRNEAAPGRFPPCGVNLRAVQPDGEFIPSSSPRAFGQVESPTASLLSMTRSGRSCSRSARRGPMPSPRASRSSCRWAKNLSLDGTQVPGRLISTSSSGGGASYFLPFLTSRSRLYLEPARTHHADPDGPARQAVEQVHHHIISHTCEFHCCSPIQSRHIG